MKYTSQLFVKIAIDSVFIRLNSYVCILIAYSM